MKSQSNRTKKARAEFVMTEKLEDRLLMAGNVLAAVTHGNLSILGGLESNDVVVTAGVNPGDFVVASGADATHINGQVGPITLHGVTGNVQIKLGLGNDSLQLSGLAIAKNLTVDAGLGNNSVTVDTATTIGGNLSITAGKGDLTSTLNSVSVTGSATLKAGVGAGTLTIDTLSVTKALSISGGWANDTVSFASVGGAATLVGTNVTIDASTFNDKLTVSAGSTVSLVSSSAVKAVAVATGKGPATVTVDGCTFSAMFALTTGAGIDTINIATAANTTFAGGASFFCGAGNDAMTVGYDGAENLGAGTIGMFQGKVTFDGGLGSDTLNYLANGSTFAQAPKIKGMETIR